VEYMDRARRLGGLAWVGGGVIFQLGWVVWSGVVPGTITVVLSAVAVGLAALFAAGAGSTLIRAGGWMMAALLALDFAGAVADRFGAFGPPGGPGVSWGSWAVFVDYTQVMLGGSPRPLATAAAVAATGVEILLAVALVAGYRRRWTGKVTAGLLAIYLVAMTLTIGLDEVATYAIPVLVGGALLVSVCPAGRGHVSSGTACGAATTV
jgi:hypothetical protein